MFNIGDIVVVKEDADYGITCGGSLGIVTQTDIPRDRVRIAFIRLVNAHGHSVNVSKNMLRSNEFTIYINDLEHANNNFLALFRDLTHDWNIFSSLKMGPELPAIFRKIRAMEERFEKRKEKKCQSSSTSRVTTSLTNSAESIVSSQNTNRTNTTTHFLTTVSWTTQYTPTTSPNS